MRHTSQDKLNAIHIGGSIGIAAICAVLTSSWILFVFVAAALIATGLSTGDIRMPRDQHRK